MFNFLQILVFTRKTAPTNQCEVIVFISKCLLILLALNIPKFQKQRSNNMVLNRDGKEILAKQMLR